VCGCVCIVYVCVYVVCPWCLVRVLFRVYHACFSVCELMQYECVHVYACMCPCVHMKAACVHMTAGATRCVYMKAGATRCVYMKAGATPFPHRPPPRLLTLTMSLEPKYTHTFIFIILCDFSSRHLSCIYACIYTAIYMYIYI